MNKSFGTKKRIQLINRKNFDLVLNFFQIIIFTCDGLDEQNSKKNCCFLLIY